MNYPKITIVTPVFNQVNYIERTIKSIIDQDYPNLEYIIVDGGSTDGTLTIIDKYRDKVTNVITEPDEGMYHALNKGLKISTGEIMAWLNADDLYHSKSLFIVAEIFEKFKEIEFLMGQATTFDENDRCLQIGELKNWSKYDFYISKSNWVIQQESTFWRRSLWERSGSFINTKYKLAADCELWTRFLIAAGAKLYMTNALLGGFRVRENQLSSNKKIYQEEVNQIYNITLKSEKDKKVLEQIVFYKKYLIKIPILRFLLHWNRKYKELYGYPPLIKYNFQEKQFIKSKMNDSQGRF